MKRASMRARAVAAAVFTALMVISPVVWATDYKICGKWQIQLADANTSVSVCGGPAEDEDYFTNYHSGVPDPWMLAYTRYARIRLMKTVNGVSYNQAKYADSSGCATFTGFPGQASMTNAGVMVNSEWYHAGDDVTMQYGVSDDIAQSHDWIVFANMVPTPTTNTVYVGSSGGQATLAASAGFAFYRARQGVEDATMRIVDCDDDGCSSAHYDSSGLASSLSRVRVYDGTDTSADDHRRRKFVIAHELGHSWAQLLTGQFELAFDSTFWGNGCCAWCHDAIISGYTMNGDEWNVVGARESYAHFYAARVWNDTSDNAGVFRWIDNTTYDLECYTASNPSGGRKINACVGTASCKLGKSINEDWMRFWWDVHTPTSSSTFTAGQLADIYTYTQTHGTLAGTYPQYIVTKDTYHDAFRNAMIHVTSNQTLIDLWDSKAFYNAVSQ